MFQIKSSLFLVTVISISVVNSGFDNEEYGQTSAAPDKKEELHMDFVPTGYLPDSVYRELAWYGILQIQPLYYSTKHKVAARWIWQNTLGRPHIILENSAQTTEFEGKGGQTLMEESAKWVRDQRSAIDVLMENIRAGGNGLTVRTVISSTKKSAFIIQSGKTYECGPDSEPDIDAFRAQSNMHERRCSEDKEPKLVPLDMCMEAEFTPVEYSYVNGWNFCMGDGERDSSYKENGDLDCGQKKKVAYSRFLEECAIDKNVVITFDYYGDEPRKDLIRNTTLCTTWDPCRFSYLYRIEISDIDKPDNPTTTPDPCDTTFCPECVENYSEEPIFASEDGTVSQITNTDALEWVPTTYADVYKYRAKALVGGHFKNSKIPIPVIRAKYKGWIINGKLVSSAYVGYHGQEILINGTFEIAIPKNGSNLLWVRGIPGTIYDNAVVGGETTSLLTYICRAYVDGHLIPGKLYLDNPYCMNTHKVQVRNKDYEILINDNKPTKKLKYK